MRSNALTLSAAHGKRNETDSREVSLAIHPSAIKRHRQSLKRRAVNKEARSRLRTLIKKARQAIEKKDSEQISNGLREVSSALGKAVSKGIVKKNTASRWLARLARNASRPA
jgi:small subunit ribosomal protein S20